MSESFKLPGSSYEELIKIVKAYSTSKIGVQMSLENVAQATGMDKTVVSRNNGFLVQLGFISEGNQKSPTQIGWDIGRAYTNNMDEEVARIWRETIEKDEFLSRMLSAVKIRNGMEKASLINHILYSSGSKTNNNTRTGANTVIEVYKVASLISETDGKVSTIDYFADTESIDNHNSQATALSIPSAKAQPATKARNNEIHISININIETKVDELDLLPEKIKSLVNGIQERE